MKRSVEPDREGGSFINLAVDSNASAERLDLRLYQEQADTARLLMFVKGFMKSEEFIPEALQINTLPVVRHV